MKFLFKLLLGVFTFVFIWAVLLIISPFLLAALCGKIAFDFIWKKKIDKVLAPKYIPATTDNNIHSAN